MEVELSNKFSLEWLASNDPFLLKHPVFNTLNTHLKAFDKFRADYEVYNKTYKVGTEVETRYRNFGAELKLHSMLRSLLENVTMQIGNDQRDRYLQRCQDWFTSKKPPLEIPKKRMPSAKSADRKPMKKQSTKLPAILNKKMPNNDDTISPHKSIFKPAGTYS